jgi:hypothetical protein
MRLALPLILTNLRLQDETLEYRELRPSSSSSSLKSGTSKPKFLVVYWFQKFLVEVNHIDKPNKK